MATNPIVEAPRPKAEPPKTEPPKKPPVNPLKAAWLRFGTPVLVLLMALALAVAITRNWNSWEGGRIDQVTNDAFVRRDVTPLGTKVAGLVREVKVSDYQQVRKGDELVLLATHGVLHLLGYDHGEPEQEREMFGLQNALLADWRSARHDAAAREAQRRHDSRLLGTVGLEDS